LVILEQWAGNAQLLQHRDAADLMPLDVLLAKPNTGRLDKQEREKLIAKLTEQTAVAKLRAPALAQQRSSRHSAKETDDQSQQSRRTKASSSSSSSKNNKRTATGPPEPEPKSNKRRVTASRAAAASAAAASSPSVVSLAHADQQADQDANNDDFCAICEKPEGVLLMCEACVKAYHVECIHKHWKGAAQVIKKLKQEDPFICHLVRLRCTDRTNAELAVYATSSANEASSPRMESTAAAAANTAAPPSKQKKQQKKKKTEQKKDKKKEEKKKQRDDNAMEDVPQVKQRDIKQLVDARKLIVDGEVVRAVEVVELPPHRTVKGQLSRFDHLSNMEDHLPAYNWTCGRKNKTSEFVADFDKHTDCPTPPVLVVVEAGEEKTMSFLACRACKRTIGTRRIQRSRKDRRCLVRDGARTAPGRRAHQRGATHRRPVYGVALDHSHRDRGRA
jgi:hypothetical protein